MDAAVWERELPLQHLPHPADLHGREECTLAGPWGTDYIGEGLSGAAGKEDARIRPGFTNRNSNLWTKYRRNRPQ